MRLIDADELKKEVLKWMPSDPCGIEEKESPFETDIVVSLMMEIEEAPTVEPKRGEWVIRFPYEDTGKTRTCSNCNITQTVNVYDGVVRFKFCPYCGAMMKGADYK